MTTLAACAAAVAAALAVLVATRPGARARRRLGPLRTSAGPAASPGDRRAMRRSGERRRRAPDGWTTPAATATAALGAWSLAGPRAGPVAALLVVAYVPRVLRGLPARARADRDRDCTAAVPLLADVVAACVAAGAAVDAAVEQAAAVVGGPLGAEAAGAARAGRLGLPPRVAWAPLLAADRPAPVRAFARAIVRAGESGAAPAALLRAVADDARAAARTDGEAAARRAAVVAVLPLGLCFLPAFVLAGVVPLVAGLLAGAF